MLDFTRKFSWSSSYDRSEPVREDRLDESGLAAMHLAAQANQVSRIDELVRRHAGIRNISFNMFNVQVIFVSLSVRYSREKNMVMGKLGFVLLL